MGIGLGRRGMKYLKIILWRCLYRSVAVKRSQIVCASNQRIAAHVD